MGDWPPFVPFDWISPLRHLGSIAFSGNEPMNVYMPGSGMTGHEVAELLRSHGIRVGPGGFRYMDYIVITVDDRETARAILDEYGIGIT